MSVEDTGGKEKIDLIQKPARSKDETPSPLEQSDIKTPEQQFLSYLGDIMHMESIVPILYARYANRSEEGRRSTFDSAKERIEKLPEEKQATEMEILEEQTMQRKEGDEEYARNQAKKERNELVKGRKMIGLRHKAEKLYTRFYKGASSPNIKTRLLVNARKLWEEMQSFVEDYMKYGDGYIRVESLEQDASSIVDQMKAEFDKVMAVNKERGETRDVVRVMYRLPVEGRKEFWDSEAIYLHADSDGKICRLEVEEQISPSQYSVTLEELQKTLTSGARLTPSQLQLLIDNQVIRFDDLTPEQWQNLRLNSEKLVRINWGDELEDDKKYLNPLNAFAFSLEEGMLEKIKGRSFEEVASYMTGKAQVGPLTMSGRLHDFGENQVIWILETKGLKNTDVWEIVKRYIEVLKAFPRVPRVYG